MRKKRNRLPRIPHYLFKWFCREERYEELHGDLEELYQDQLLEKGRFRAAISYGWDVLRCCQPYAWKKIKGQSHSTFGMFKNFYLTAIRSSLRHKSYFLINLFGLAIGIASFVFIALYAYNEASFDIFHSKYRNTYRISSEAIIRGEPNYDAVSAPPLAKTLEESYPEVAVATRVLRSENLLLRKEDRKVYEDGILFTDENFFDVFDFQLIKGNPKTALASPRSMVLTASYAKKYFGSEDPVGKELSVEDEEPFFKVTGVVKDPPANSHIQFDILASLATYDRLNGNRWVTVGMQNHTYVVLQSEADPNVLEDKMKEIFYKYVAPEIEYYTGLSIGEWEASGNEVNYQLTPIKDIHLYSNYKNELEASGNVTYLYTYAVIGLVILFIAIFNFVNLATAHSTTRAKEVGIRKVIGSSKQALITQFMVESIFIAAISGVVAVVLIVIFAPSFEKIIGKTLSFDWSQPMLWGMLLILILAVGILAGIYPSFMLSRFRPTAVLKGTSKTGTRSGWIRNFLVTLQQRLLSSSERW